MPIDVQRVWLTEETYERARIELAFLQMERAMGAHRGGSDRERRALRIRQLHELLTTADVGHEPPDDGVAEPGMVLTVHYEADDLTETFLMADREESASHDLPICSPHSPLGKALCGAKAGDQREYPVPEGETMTITLLAAVPFRRRTT